MWKKIKKKKFVSKEEKSEREVKETMKSETKLKKKKGKFERKKTLWRTTHQIRKCL